MYLLDLLIQLYFYRILPPDDRDGDGDISLLHNFEKFHRCFEMSSTSRKKVEDISKMNNQ